MATTKEKISLKKRSGIYYSNKYTFSADDGTAEYHKIAFTSDADLIDTRINQTSARHVKKDVVIVRGKL